MCGNHFHGCDVWLDAFRSVSCLTAEPDNGLRRAKTLGKRSNHGEPGVPWFDRYAKAAEKIFSCRCCLVSWIVTLTSRARPTPLTLVQAAIGSSPDCPSPRIRRQVPQLPTASMSVSGCLNRPYPWKTNLSRDLFAPCCEQHHATQAFIYRFLVSYGQPEEGVEPARDWKGIRCAAGRRPRNGLACVPA